jgi:hypothetical protein
MKLLARKLFDTGLYSALTPGGAIGVGWKLNFYTAGTSTRANSYNAPSGGSANANPLPADAGGRFDEAWLETGSSYKWVLTDENGVVKVTVDNFAVAADPPSIDSDLDDFLVGTDPLPVASGGTGATNAADAATNLAVLKLSGGPVTGNIVRSTKGVHLYFNNALMTGGQMYVQAAGADPTANPGDIVFEY